MTTSGVPRVALFSELPTPYRWPVFERLLGSDEIDLRIFFCARGEPDREWEFDFRPDARVRFLPGRTFSWRGRRTIHYHLNHTVFGLLHPRRFDVAVLPGYLMFASHMGALCCRFRGLPYVIFSETHERGRRPFLLRAAKGAALPVIIGGASAWLATGKLSKEYLLGWGAREDRVFRFPNSADAAALGAEADRRRAERDGFRARHGAAAGPVALFVGRLIDVKRCDLLIRAAARIPGEGGGARLWVVGDGPERRRLEALAELHCPGRVRFFGNLRSRELPLVYASADLFVLPSDHEPWGAVVCEAAACGLPIVVSDRVGAGPDVVAEGENGSTFPAGDETALAESLERLLSDPEGLRRMGRVSRDRSGRFDHASCVAEFLSAVSAARGNGA